MGRKGLLDIAVPRLKQYMAEQDRAMTIKDVTAFLDISQTSAYQVLLYMESIQSTIEHVKIGRTKHYFLKGTLNEGRLAAMQEISKAKVSRRSRSRIRAIPEKPRTESLLAEHLATIEERASSGWGPSALAIIGFPQLEAEEQVVHPQEPPLEQDEDLDNTMVGGDTIFIIREPSGRVRDLPKDFRLLTIAQTRYLKERHLKEIAGYDKIEGFSAFFSDFSALEKREYGNTFYASHGTNPWEKTYRLKVVSTGAGK